MMSRAESKRSSSRGLHVYIGREDSKQGREHDYIYYTNMLKIMGVNSLSSEGLAA